MKTIIFVSGLQVFPPQSGGQLRSANFCRSLAELGHDVKVYSFTGRKADYLSGKKSGEEIIGKSLSEFVNRHPFFGGLQFLFYACHLPPLWLTWLMPWFLPKKLRSLLKKGDAVILDFPFLHPLSRHTDLPVFINTHNAEFELYSSKGLSAYVKKIEVEAFAKARAVFFCSSKDEEKFLSALPLLAKKSRYLPNGVDLKDFVFNQEERQRLRREHGIAPNQKVFLFTGSRYLPNREAAQFLIDWAHHNAASLTELGIVILIAGSVWEESIDRPYLKVVGIVPQMKPYFWASDWGLNPVASGSGTNVKMIEFIAAQLPIVSSPFGARGLALSDQRTCLFFTPETLLSTLKKASALKDEERREMAQGALAQNSSQVDMTSALAALSMEW